MKFTKFFLLSTLLVSVANYPAFSADKEDQKDRGSTGRRSAAAESSVQDPKPLEVPLRGEIESYYKAVAKLHLDSRQWKEFVNYVAPAMAAQGMVPDDLFMVGQMFERQGGIIPASEFYLGASQRGCHEATSRLADLYFCAELPDPGLENCMALLTGLARGNSVYKTSALCRLGLIYRGGIPSKVSEDKDRAEQYFSEAAALGNSEAQVHMAEICREKGGEDNFAKALEYYGRAMEKGHSAAFTGLAEMYEKGEGVTPDLDKARELAKEGEKRKMASI